MGEKSIITRPPEQLFLLERGRCGAATGDAVNPFCKLFAGDNTSHSGEGQCWLHESERLSRYERLRTKIIGRSAAEHAADPAPLNTLEDIALVRALLEDYVLRYTTFSEALLHWHETATEFANYNQVVDAVDSLLGRIDGEWSMEDKLANLDYQILKRWTSGLLTHKAKRPLKIVELSTAINHLDVVSKMVERVGKRMDAQSISRKDFLRVMNEISNIVDQCVLDDATKLRIKEKFSNLKFG